MEKLINVMKALSDETRLRILNLLYENDLCVCDIMEALQISLAKASKHLIYMKNAGLINDRKHAQWVYYSISDDEKTEFLDSLIYNELRDMEPYKNDVENLNTWLGKKDITC